MKKKYTFEVSPLYSQITVKAENEEEAREKVIKEWESNYEKPELLRVELL